MRMVAAMAALTLLLAGCGTGGHVGAISTIQISKRPYDVPKTTYEGRTYIVKPGDNLYSIGFVAALDYHDIARWNDIDSRTFIIHPGQKLKLYPPDDEIAPVSETSASGGQGAGTSAASQPASSAASSGGGKAPAKAASAGKVSAAGWEWPSQGDVIRHYSPGANQNGIHIAGELGQSVRAAQGGEVVYEGTGLPGYGRMIIVKHDENLLSAYAHNSRIVVKEGDIVQRGQKIAEMGNTEAERVKLHFEIRLNGKPVDPIRYLPKA